MRKRFLVDSMYYTQILLLTIVIFYYRLFIELCLNPDNIIRPAELESAQIAWKAIGLPLTYGRLPLTYGRLS